MTLNKIIGYILLVAGLLLILFSVYQSYNIYTGKSSAPLVFQVPSAEALSSGAGQNVAQQIQDQINQSVQKQINQILPSATIAKILNLAVWSFLVFILIFAGGTISGIGVKLIKAV
jgi:hypothetical protein